MAKQLMFEEAAHRKIQVGMRKLAAAVRVTLGPSGRNVLLDKKSGAPQATKDGITVSKEVELEDPFENIGAKLIHTAVDKTNDVAGDGTTTSAVLAEAIYSGGLKLIAAGANANLVKSGIDKGVEAAVASFKTQSKPVQGVEDYRNVARVASHFDEELADQVSRAMEKVGRDGVITVEESKGVQTTMEVVDGLQFDKGYISPYFVNKPEGLVAEFDEALILAIDKKLSSLKDLLPLLEKVAQVGKPLLIIAEEVEGEALTGLVVNRLRGALQVCAVKAPAFGDRRKAILQDIAILTGGTVVSDDLGMKLENLSLSSLGRARRVRVEKEKCTLIGGGGDREAIDRRAGELRASIRKTTSEYDREKYQERLAKLTGGVAIVKVGGLTEAEMKERKFRVEDAVHATRAAALEGIVPGGGVAYLRAAEAVGALPLQGDEAAGARVLANALESPLFNIAGNAGFDPSVVVSEVRTRTEGGGLDVTTGQYVDLFQAGVVDAAKVCRAALQNAAGITSLVLTSEAVVVELKERKKKVPGALK